MAKNPSNKDRKVYNYFKNLGVLQPYIENPDSPLTETEIHQILQKRQ